MRKLAIIVALDMAGYSARAAIDDARTASEVAALRAFITEVCSRHGGRVFNTAGDGFMLEFGSSSSAVEAAQALATGCEPRVRVGVHLGDVIVQPDGDLLGHGVNVAARLMARGEPGSAIVSADVRRTIRGPLAERLTPLGSIELDKMQESIEVFAIEGTLRQQTASAAEVASAETLLAVLPFENLSSDADLQFFSDGVSEEIIQRLARNSDIRVIGRTSSFQFRGERKAEAARALRCSHVVDGSVRRSGSRVRVSAHLLEAQPQTTLWSDRFDGSLDDVFAVQDDIAEAIATALNAAFTPSTGRAVDPAAHDLFLRATPHSFSPQEMTLHVSLLEQCVALAPGFGEAWGRLAFLRSFLRTHQAHEARAETTARVLDEIARARQVDPQDPGATLARMFLQPPFGRFADLHAAVADVLRLPDAMGARIWSGFFLRPMGYMQASLQETERAYSTDPLNPMAANALALARMAVGRYEGVVTLLTDLMARIPDMHYPTANLMRAHAFLGNREEVDRLLAPDAGRPLRELQDGVLFIRTKQYPTPENVGEMRRKLLSGFEATGGVEVSQLVYAAHVGLGEDVFRLAETARLGPRGAEGDVLGVDAYRTGMLFWEGMPEIRSDPRFVRLCARLGMVDWWLSSGNWPDCADKVPYDFREECRRAQDVPIERYPF
jgi:TolB-like protein